MLSVWLLGCGATPEEMLPEADGAVSDVDALVDRIAPAPDTATVDAPGPVDVTRDAAGEAGRDVVVRDSSADVVRDTGVRDAGADVSRDAGAMDAGTMDAGAVDGGCPAEMVRAGGACVDRWEAALVEVDMDGGTRPWSPYHNPGGRRVIAVSQAAVVPQGYISGAQAEVACRNAGKRLCALSEWLAACRGPDGRVYPYGNSYVRRRCNEARTPHPVVQFYGTSVGVFTFDNMNNPGINMQPDTVARTGAFADCVSPLGAFDMVGNLHEWIADSAGTFKGGFYVDAEINGRGCLYTTTAHAFSYRDYSTGFRCCADPR